MAFMAARLSGERTRGRPENLAFPGHTPQKARFNFANDTRVWMALSILKSPWITVVTGAGGRGSRGIEVGCLGLPLGEGVGETAADPRLLDTH